MATQDKQPPIDTDGTPLEWLTKRMGGADVQHDLNCIQSIAQALTFADTKLLENQSVSMLAGLILDHVNRVETTLQNGGE